MSSKTALRPNGNENLSPDVPLDAAISDADSSEDGSEPDSNHQEKLPNQLPSMSKSESQDEPASRDCPNPTPPNSPSTVDRMSNTVTLTPGRFEFTPRPGKQSQRDTTSFKDLTWKSIAIIPKRTKEQMRRRLSSQMSIEGLTTDHVER